jgi:pimeloyl-[acyl-carrier protein] methyl ester esterase
MISSGHIPIVLLPGMDGTGELLAGLARRLSPSRPVHIISYPPGKPLGYDDLTAFAATRLPEGRFAILGESFSGPVAIEIAAKEPRAAGLILASSFAWHPLPPLLAPFTRLFDSRRIPFRIVESMLLGAWTTPELRTRLSELLKKLPRETLQARTAAALRVDKRQTLRQIACPSMCLHGRFDRVTGKRCVRQIILAQPRCQVQWLDAPHMLLETHPDEAAGAIGAFCDRLKSGGSPVPSGWHKMRPAR